MKNSTMPTFVIRRSDFTPPDERTPVTDRIPGYLRVPPSVPLLPNMDDATADTGAVEPHQALEPAEPVVEPHQAPEPAEPTAQTVDDAEHAPTVRHAVTVLEIRHAVELAAHAREAKRAATTIQELQDAAKTRESRHAGELAEARRVAPEGNQVVRIRHTLRRELARVRTAIVRAETGPDRPREQTHYALVHPNDYVRVDPPHPGRACNLVTICGLTLSGRMNDVLVFPNNPLLPDCHECALFAVRA